MLSHSASASLSSPGVGSYNLPFDATSVKGTVLTEPEIQPSTHLRTSTRPQRSRFEGSPTFYAAVSSILGFREKYSLALLVVCGGALVGFCLSRTPMMSPANVRDKTASGEWFWYRQPLFKPNIFLHIYLSIISGCFAIFQFLPVIRRRAMFWHRLNGYMVLLTIIPSSICGAIVARRAFGGEINVQSAFYTDGILIVFSAIMGYRNVKHTRKHRKWMLRVVAFAAAPITTRLTTISARHIISDIGTYYAVWRCDEVLYVLQTMDALQHAYPECIKPGVDLGNAHVAIRAATYGTGLNYASSVRVTFGMSLWIGIIIHLIGVEYYIRKTESSNQHRRGFVLERDDEEAKLQLDDH